MQAKEKQKREVSGEKNSDISLLRKRVMIA